MKKEDCEAFVHRMMQAKVKKKAGGRKMLPQDPVMLLSVMNLKLRDFYSSLDVLCEDMDVEKEEILQKLATIDYHYDNVKNQFV